MLGDLLAVKVKYTDSSVAYAFVKIASTKNKENIQLSFLRSVLETTTLMDEFMKGRSPTAF